MCHSFVLKMPRKRNICHSPKSHTNEEVDHVNHGNVQMMETKCWAKYRTQTRQNII